MLIDYFEQCQFFWASCLEPCCSWSCEGDTYSDVQERAWLHVTIKGHDLVQVGAEVGVWGVEP